MIVAISAMIVDEISIVVALLGEKEERKEEKEEGLLFITRSKESNKDGREKLRCKYVCMYVKECESEETDCILCWGVGGGENGNTE